MPSIRQIFYLVSRIGRIERELGRQDEAGENLPEPRS